MNDTASSCKHLSLSQTACDERRLLADGPQAGGSKSLFRGKATERREYLRAYLKFVRVCEGDKDDIFVQSNREI